MFSRPQPLEKLDHLIEFSSHVASELKDDVVVPIADNDAIKRGKRGAKTSKRA